MNRLHYIVDEINTALKGHWFKQLTTIGVADQIEKDGQRIPAVYKGFGDYEPVGFNDALPLQLYHRVLSVDNEEDPDEGFGSHTMMKEDYSMTSVFYGNQRQVSDSNTDINRRLADEFKSLFPKRLNKAQLTNINAFNSFINIVSVDLDKQSVFKEEMPDSKYRIPPEAILFSIHYTITLSYNDCKVLSCESEEVITDLRNITCENLQDDRFGISETQADCIKEKYPCADAVVNRSDASLISVIASGGTLVVADSVIKNSLPAVIGSVMADSEVTLADVIHTDSDGAPSPTPAQVPFVCTPPVADVLGILFEDQDFATMGNYVNVGVATFTSTGGDLNISGGTGVFTNFLKQTNYGQTGLEQWKITAEFTIATNSAGIAFGVRSGHSIASALKTIIVQFDHSVAGNGGKIIISYQDTATTQKAISSTAITRTIGDRYRMVILRDNLKIAAFIENLTRGERTFVDYSANIMSGSVDSQHNAGNFSIWAIAGSQTLHWWKAESSVEKNRDYIAIGDSITYGFASGGIYTRYIGQVQQVATETIEVNAGGSDVTQSVLDKMPELLSLTPSKYLLMIGGNDIALGISQATREANYTAIVTQLKTVAPVIHLKATPRDAVDVTIHNTYIDTFAPDLIINTFTPLAYGIGLKEVYDVDNTHPNFFGHSHIASIVADDVFSISNGFYDESINPDGVLGGSFTGDDFTNTVTGYGNSGFRSIQKLQGTGYLQFRLPQTNAGCYIQLDNTVTTYDFAQTINAFVFTASALIRVYEDGVLAFTGGGYLINDIFYIYRNSSNQLFFYQNDILLYSGRTKAGNVYIHGAMNHIGTISDITLKGFFL